MGFGLVEVGWGRVGGWRLEAQEKKREGERELGDDAKNINVSQFSGEKGREGEGSPFSSPLSFLSSSCSSEAAKISDRQTPFLPFSAFLTAFFVCASFGCLSSAQWIFCAVRSYSVSEFQVAGAERNGTSSWIGQLNRARPAAGKVDDTPLPLSLSFFLFPLLRSGLLFSFGRCDSPTFLSLKQCHEKKGKEEWEKE